MASGTEVNYLQFETILDESDLNIFKLTELANSFHHTFVPNRCIALESANWDLLDAASTMQDLQEIV